MSQFLLLDERLHLQLRTSPYILNPWFNYCGLTWRIIPQTYLLEESCWNSWELTLCKILRLVFANVFWWTNVKALVQPYKVRCKQDEISKWDFNQKSLGADLLEKPLESTRTPQNIWSFLIKMINAFPCNEFDEFGLNSYSIRKANSNSSIPKHLIEQEKM